MSEIEDQERHEALVDEALRTGRVKPYQRQEWVDKLAADPSAEEELAALPIVVPLEPIGYGSKWENFDTDPWKWFDEHEPDLVLRCDETREVMARAWRAPDSQVWYRTYKQEHPPAPSPLYRPEHGQWPVLKRQVRDTGAVTVVCPTHGWALVPAQYVIDEALSKRRHAPVLCTDPRPVYRAR